MITSSLFIFFLKVSTCSNLNFHLDVAIHFLKKITPPLNIGRHMWIAPRVKTYLISPFKMLQKQVNMGGVHFEMNHSTASRNLMKLEVSWKSLSQHGSRTPWES